ncbi:urea carboxylase-associated family protein [Kaistella rhinocerotis]|uniref:urea carboxylase-associated family protein n=1 Tax=Kaistella rhinocerotis TaxID=3026437 RepID=UPI0025535ECB|nr:urea carboxylase-associated family protein [Kaistella sp. Ran72]
MSHQIQIIKPQTGKAFLLNKGQILTVTDPQGQQVSDMVMLNRHDHSEKISSGKTLDFEESILLTAGNFLWSNRSNKMVKITEDTNGRNDFLLAPCSKETFEIMYDHKGYHPSCLENLTKNLEPFGLTQDDIPTAFNIFMNVQFDEKGKISVLPPTSKAGDFVRFEAMMDLLVCLTACSAEDSNGGTFKPIHYSISDSV